MSQVFSGSNLFLGRVPATAAPPSVDPPESTWDHYWPTTWSGWWTLLLVIVGGYVGLWRAPLVLLAFGPLRWPAALAGLASQESAWGRYNVGDGGASLGPLQFHDSNPVIARDDRVSPFWSGYAAGQHVQAALVQSWRWWGMALPVVGFGLLRYCWTHGSSAAAAQQAWSGDADGVTWYRQAVGSDTRASEARAWRAWTAWRLASFVPAGLVLAWWYRR